jgi:hypothetical protein
MERWENVSWENVTMTNVTLKEPLFPSLTKLDDVKWENVTLENVTFFQGPILPDVPLAQEIKGTAITTLVLLICTISFFVLYFCCCWSRCVQGENVCECMACASGADSLDVVDDAIKPE